MSDIIIGILLVISFFFMVWYCVKGYNLMVGFAIMATVWMGLALVGNTFSPNPAMEGQGVIDVLTHIYTTGPAEYAKSILVNVFFGAWLESLLISSISNNIKRFMLVSIQRLKAILIMTISKLV